MAEINLTANDRITAHEIAKYHDKDSILIIDALKETNELLLDMPFIPCNEGTKHRVYLTNTESRLERRNYYAGTSSTATSIKSYEEDTVVFERFSFVDELLVQHNQSAAVKARNATAKGIINGMGKVQTTMFLYGNKDNYQEGMNGFLTRLPAVDGIKTFKVHNNAAGTTYAAAGTDLVEDVLLVAYGEQFCHGIYPEGSVVGVKRRDNGRQSKQDAAGQKYYVLEDQFDAEWGLAIPNPHAVKRITGIVPGGTSSEELIAAILDLQLRAPTGAPSYVLYAGYNVRAMINQNARDKGNVIYPTSDPWGRPIQMIGESRIRTVERMVKGTMIADAS